VNAAQPPPAEDRSGTDPHSEETQSFAAAIAEVSERATLLVREEIELAKAEMSEKATKLVKGAVVGAAAGVFFLTALVFALVGCAWVLYFYLPIGNDYSYFYGFFAMAVILAVLGVLAGLIAARAVKKGSPPVPSMAIDEARKIRESVKPAADAGQLGEQEEPSHVAEQQGPSEAGEQPGPSPAPEQEASSPADERGAPSPAAEQDAPES
jgi:hypothetical protein